MVNCFSAGIGWCLNEEVHRQGGWSDPSPVAHEGARGGSRIVSHNRPDIEVRPSAGSYAIISCCEANTLSSKGRDEVVSSYQLYADILLTCKYDLICSRWRLILLAPAQADDAPKSP